MDVTDEKKLSRFLHYASILGTYRPGSRLHPAHYTDENREQLSTILKNMPKEKIFEIIKKVFSDNSSPHPEMIAFVLSECCRVGALKKDALITAKILYDNTKLFMLFLKFSFETTPKLSCGRAFRKFIREYYLKKEPLKLANEVTMLPTYRGWSHKDLFRLGHLAARRDDIERQVIFTYISRGVKSMNSCYGDEPKAKEITEYFNKVDNFRKEVDPFKVSETIDSYMLTLEHVNCIHLKNRDVWRALLRRIPLDTLLDHFRMITRNKLLRRGKHWDLKFIASIRDAMENNQAIRDSGLHPSRVFIESVAYQSEPLYNLMCAAKENMTDVQTPPPIETGIVKALDALMKATTKLIKPTNLRYAIALDTRNIAMSNVKHIPFMFSSDLAAFIILHFLTTEPNVMIANSFDGVSKITTTQQLSNMIIEATMMMPKQIETFIDYSRENKIEVDCFIFLGTEIRAHLFVSKFEAYKRSMKLPKSKVVLISLCGLKNTVDRNDIFVVSGFDDKVLPLVASFVKEDI